MLRYYNGGILKRNPELLTQNFNEMYSILLHKNSTKFQPESIGTQYRTDGDARHHISMS